MSFGVVPGARLLLRGCLFASLLAVVPARAAAEVTDAIPDSALDSAPDSAPDTAAAPAASESGKPPRSGRLQELESVTVTGRRYSEPEPKTDFRAAAVISLKDIEQTQASSLFQLIETAPGVSLAGGPRANGTSIIIRGMGNNEDVLITLDGAVKNFEKYRFGGTFIEPELLKQVAIFRGPAGVVQGGGALGGVIEMETKSAADLLGSGQHYGAMLKYGHASNNHEEHKVAALYGMPGERWGFLLSSSRRDADNFKLADGVEMMHSAEEPATDLVKLNGFGDDWRAALTLTRFKQTGREFYDATAGARGGVNGEVYRKTEDKTAALTSRYAPQGSELIDLTFNYGFTRTQVHDDRLDEHNQLNGIWGDYLYKIQYATLRNTSQWQWAPLSTQLTYGIQHRREERVTDSGNLDGATNTVRLSEPGGLSTNTGAFLLSDWRYRGWQAGFGYRRDAFDTEVYEPETLALLNQSGQSKSVHLNETVTNLLFAYHFERVPLTLSANRIEAARPPKMDESFTQSQFGLCLALSPAIYNIPSLQYLRLQYPPLPAPYGVSGVCGDLYQPERAVSTEFELEYRQAGVLTEGDTLSVLATVFENRITHVLQSLRTDPANPTAQPGKERYEGLEAELRYTWSGWMLELGYSYTDAEETGFLRSGSGPTLAIQYGTQSLYTVPGPLATWTLSWTNRADTLELGWSGMHRRSWDALATLNDAGVGTTERQDAYTTHQLFARWQPLENTTLHLTVNNLTDVEYRLPGGFGGTLGNVSVGRNIKVSLTQKFGW